MFNGRALIQREPLTEHDLRSILSGGVISCLNKSHPATLRALKTRCKIDLPIPEFPPRISLEIGDSIVLITLRGLPRHTKSYQYTDGEVARATFSFSRWIRIE